MEVFRIANGPYQTNSYLLKNEKGVSLIDAPFPASRLIDAIKSKGELTSILLTHGHFDHTLALPDLQKEFPKAKIYMNSRDLHYFLNGGEDMLRELAAFDPFFASRYAGNASALPETVINLNDGDEIEGLKVILLPGHTPGSAGFYYAEQQLLFSGDTVFAGSVGRVDLGGDEKMLLESIEKIKALPSATMLLPGHGAPTTVEEEKASNPYFR